MYSKQQASQIKQEFWTAFGKYMAPVVSADGEKINWINYKTGRKGVVFKMEATVESAFIGIIISGNNDERENLYNQFLSFKNLFQQDAGEEWKWEKDVASEHSKTESCIYITQTGINVFKKEDWPAFISFFKPRIIGLDAFWSQVKYLFE